MAKKVSLSELGLVTTTLEQNLTRGINSESISNKIKKLLTDVATEGVADTDPNYVVVKENLVDEAVTVIRRLLVMSGVSDADDLVNRINSIFSTVTTPDSMKEKGVDLIESNISYFFDLGRQRVPEFMRLHGKDIEWRGKAEKDFTSEEREKILHDFHYFLMRQISNVILDDQHADAFILGMQKKLRIKKTWNPDSDTFMANPSDSEQTTKRVDQWWSQIKSLSDGLANLWEQAYKFVADYMTIQNKAVDIIEKTPNGKVGDEEILKILPDIEYGFSSVVNILSGATSAPTLNGEYLQRKDNHNVVLGKIIRQTLLLYEYSYRNAKFGGVNIPFGWPHQTQPADEMYKACEQIIKRLVDEAEAKGEITFYEPKEKEDNVRWGLDQAFKIIWAYGQAFNWDKVATKSSFAEGANAETYHARNAKGIPDKTAYADASSKTKSPVVTNRPNYYPSYLELTQINVVINTDHVHVGEGEAEIRDYFENYLVAKYGSPDAKRASREYKEALGQMPQHVALDKNGNPNYRAIAADFVIIQTKQQYTDFGQPADKLFVRKDALLSQQLKDKRKHLTLKMSAYDVLIRAQFPHFENDIQLNQAHLLATPGENKENYIKMLGYEHKFFMAAAMTKGIAVFSDKIRDLVDWVIDPSFKTMSLMKSMLNTFKNVADFSNWLALVVLRSSGFSTKKDIGVSIFDYATNQVQIKTDLLTEVFPSSGLKALVDHIFKYYSDAVCKLETRKLVKPLTDESSNLIGLQPENNVAIRPRAFSKLYRNVFIPWKDHPYFASARSYDWTKKLEQAIIDGDQEQMEIAKFVLENDQEYFTLISLYIGQFMYVYDEEREMNFRAQSRGSWHELMMRFHADTSLRRTISTPNGDENKFVQPLYPEDVATQLSLFRKFFVYRAKVLYEKLYGRLPNESEIEAFLGLMGADSYDKDRVDTWGLTEEKFDLALRYLYSAYGITSGPNAGGVALDWLIAASKGLIKRYVKTDEQMSRVRRLQGWLTGGGLLGGEDEKKN